MSPEGGLSCPLTIQTGPVAAAVQFLLTVGTGVAWRAATGVAPSHRLHTRAAIEAGTICTCHCDNLAVLTVESLRAGAGVIVLQVLWRVEEKPLC